MTAAADPPSPDRHALDDEASAEMVADAKQHIEAVYPLLVTAALELDDPVEHIRAMTVVYDYLGALHEDVLATAIVALLWPEARLSAAVLRDDAAKDIAAMTGDGPAGYVGRRRMQEPEVQP